MPHIEIVILAFSLALDASAVALALSATGCLETKRGKFRIAFHFGLFQFMMPVAGWAIGAQLEPFIASFGHWIAAGLLSCVALRMIRSSRHFPRDQGVCDPSRGWCLVTLSTVTSIDALIVGLGLAALRMSIWYPAVIIGLVTMVLSILAMLVGERAGKKLGRGGQIIGGSVLLLVALNILVSHIS